MLQIDLIMCIGFKPVASIYITKIKHFCMPFKVKARTCFNFWQSNQIMSQEKHVYYTINHCHKISLNEWCLVIISEMKMFILHL